MSDANFGFNSPTSNRYMPVSEANSSGKQLSVIFNLNVLDYVII